MKYEVHFKDYESGATSPVDVIDAQEGYTAQTYIQDCIDNADPEWIEMLSKGEVSIIPIEDEVTVQRGKKKKVR